MSELSRLELVIDSKGVVTANGNLDIFKKKSDEAAKAATGVENANKKNAKSFDLVNEVMNAQTLVMGAANLGLIKFMNSIAATTGKVEMLKANLQVVTGSAVLADKTFRELQEFAAKTPFGIEGISDTAIQLLNVNVAADDLMATLQMLGDVSGGSQEKLNRIMMNYTQILSVGKASTMDIKQFAQANLPIYAELERVTGKSGEALQAMITNGEITGEVVTKAFRKMTEAGGKFYNGMAIASETWLGKKSTMEDSISNLARAFGDLWLLDFQKNAFDAITAVADKIALELDKLSTDKKAMDAVFNDPANASFEDWERSSNIEIEYFRKEAEKIKQEYLNRQKYSHQGMVDKYASAAGLSVEEDKSYLNDERYKRAKDAEFMWMDELEKRNKAKADEIRLEREATEAAEASAVAAKKAAEEAAKWQKVLKEALDLEEVTTGAKAVTDYINNVETSMNGSLAYAQAFGGSVVDIYTEHSEQVKKAVLELLQSGFWTPDEATIQRLISFSDRLNKAAEGRKGFTNPQFGQASNPDFMNSNPFGLSPFGSGTGFNVGISENDGIWLSDERIRKEEEQAERLKQIYHDLGEQLKQFAADATFDALWDMGEALYEGEDAAKAFGKSLLQSILQNVPAMLFQTGFQLALTGNVYGGLALMALSGLGAVAGGYLTKTLNDSNLDEDKRERLERLTQQLADLISQSKANAEYFASGLRSRNADYLNSVVSVNDAIITKEGKVIHTHPDDLLVAMKSTGAFPGGVSSQVQVTIINSYSNEIDVDAEERTRADGTKEIVATLRKLVKSDFARGEYDSVLESRTSAIRSTGRRVSQ